MLLLLVSHFPHDSIGSGCPSFSYAITCTQKSAVRCEPGTGHETQASGLAMLVGSGQSQLLCSFGGMVQCVDMYEVVKCPSA